jgi:hypothetical protein
VSMRAALPYVLALVLGVSAGLLAACGSSSSDRKQFIPQRSADRLSNALADVRSAVADGDCEQAGRAIARARGVLVNMSPAVSDRLRSRLRQGVDNLQKIAPDECRKNQTTSTETTTETTTPETTTSTPTTATTATTDTTTTPTTSTSTTDTTTTPTTTTGTTTTAPPATTTTDPADPSGGTTTP